MKYKFIFLTLSMLSLGSCTEKVKTSDERIDVVANSKENESNSSTTVNVTCKEIITKLIKNSNFKSPFKNDIKATIESTQGNTIKVQLSENNSDNTIGWILIEVSKKRILDITNDIENPVNVVYKSGDWETFINCNKQTKNTALVSSGNIDFGDLFNENAVLKFTPEQLETDDEQIKTFKSKLTAFENQHPQSANFNPENLNLLINNLVFANSDSYVDSSWLDYFIKKYSVNVRELPELFETVVTQEDFNSVKVLVSNGFVVSLKQVQLAKTIKAAAENKKLRNKNNKGLDEQGDPQFYLDKNSQINEIETFLEKVYNSNTVSDTDRYVNVRKEKNASSSTVDKINNGDKVEVLDNSGKWWQVRTKRGKEGYLFGEKVK